MGAVSIDTRGKYHHLPENLKYLCRCKYGLLVLVVIFFFGLSGSTIVVISKDVGKIVVKRYACSNAFGYYVNPNHKFGNVREGVFRLKFRR